MSSPQGVLQVAINHTFDGVRKALESFTPQVAPREVGVIKNVAIGIATISGLPSVGYEELVRFPGGLLGMAFNVWMPTRLALFCWANFRIFTRAMKWNARAASWMYR